MVAQGVLLAEPLVSWNTSEIPSVLSPKRVCSSLCAQRQHELLLLLLLWHVKHEHDSMSMQYPFSAALATPLE